MQKDSSLVAISSNVVAAAACNNGLIIILGIDNCYKLADIQVTTLVADLIDAQVATDLVGS